MEEKPRLIIIPIAHTPADMGSLRSSVPFSGEYEAKVTGYWADIFRYLKNLPDVSGFKIYQDGLPDVAEDFVAGIVTETQTSNYEILRWLKEQGAKILGTEDPNLLHEEYESTTSIINQGGHSTIDDVIKRSLLLEQRDDYIAQRIKDTLKPEETGLLFIGAAHNVARLLKNDCQIIDPEINPHGFSEVMRAYYGNGKEKV